MSTVSIPRNPAPVAGYTSSYQLLVDLDNSTFPEAYEVARLIYKTWPEVKAILIARSSQNHHHLVGGSLISHELQEEIMRTLLELNVINGRFDEVLQYRTDFTLRVSPKISTAGYKPAPTPLIIVNDPGYTPETWSDEWFGGILQYLMPLSVFNPGGVKKMLISLGVLKDDSY